MNTNETNNKKSYAILALPICMSIGLALGSAIGPSIGGISTGICYGLLGGVGLGCIGFAILYTKLKKSKNEE